MTILRTVPARNLLDMHGEVNRLFDGLLTPARTADAARSIPVDLDENEAGFAFAFDLPGIRPEDVKVTVHESVLTVRGERPMPTVAEGATALRRERAHGSFTRSFTLRTPVDVDGIQATSRDGVLTLFVPRAEQAKPREIRIDVA